MKNIGACKAVLLGALAVSLNGPAAGDEYVFINPETYPAQNPSHGDASSSTSLVFGSLDGSSVSGGLEARPRTVDDSVGMALRSDKFRSFYLVIR